MPLDVSSCKPLFELSYFSPILKIKNNKCNSESLSSIYLNIYTRLKSIEIGNKNMQYIKSFYLNGLTQLESLKIGGNSFTMNRKGFGNDILKSFHIVNCGKLELIEIGQYSFSDFAGQFELRNLPSLKSIRIGIVGKGSLNFYYSDMIIESMNIYCSL